MTALVAVLATLLIARGRRRFRLGVIDSTGQPSPVQRSPIRRPTAHDQLAHDRIVHDARTRGLRGLDPPAPGARKHSTERFGQRERRRAAMVAGALVAIAVFGALPATVFGLLAVLGRRARTLRRRRVEERHRVETSPDVIELLVAAVRAGLHPAHALVAVQPFVGDEWCLPFDDVARRLAAGERFADALTSLTGSLGRVADAFGRADRYGEELAPVLDRLAVDARDERRRLAEISARRLPISLSFPLVTCTLPSFVVLAIVPLLIGAFSSLSSSW